VGEHAWQRAGTTTSWWRERGSWDLLRISIQQPAIHYAMLGIRSTASGVIFF
jgi:hypothetical protein